MILVGEKEGSRDIYPDNFGRYTLFKEDGFTVQAAPLQHTVPCVGYVVTEEDRPGRLRIENVTDLVERNTEAIKKKYNLKDARQFYKTLKVITI